MAGIYLHIPFCKQACHYCNFHFSTSLASKDNMLQALLAEIGLRKGYLEGAPVATIYFGGGTPSLLEVHELAALLAAVRTEFHISADAEITLEANPDDITPDKLSGWKDAGVNRLSIGIQSFFGEELQWMNRAHNAYQARQCIEDSLRAGFQNFSIDLIYGSPLLSDAQWEENVRIATAYGVPHVSCYALTVEEKTALHALIRSRKKEAVAEERQAAQFLMLMEWLHAKGYEHYEVSNFALPGYRSRHNGSYWKGVPYLGLGPSAHSFNAMSRCWNIANNALYIKSIKEGKFQPETEWLTPDNRYNESVMIGLRTIEGIDLAAMERQWGAGETAIILQKMAGALEQGLVLSEDGHLRLTNTGMLQADGLAASLFRVE